jgi:hypothetical protein
MSSDDELLNERLASQEPSDRLSAVTRKGVDSNDCQAVATPSPTHTTFDYTEWGIAPNGIFRPSGARCNILPAGVYRAGLDVGGVYFENRNVITDELIELDDTASLRVLAGIRTFWKSKEEYTKRSIIYKRGILLWGPAGSGKTATLMMMTRELVALGGLVILCENPELTNKALQALRRIEPDRPIIILMEDIEELISSHGEHDILALLDGENQINNVVNIATTNYPEVLGARIVNRPSRFDERIFVGMPSDAARRRYLSHATRNEVFSEQDLEGWVTDTDGFSVAHLRELVVAVFCLKQGYGDVVERLRAMKIQPKSTAEFGGAGNTGFNAPKKKGHYAGGNPSNTHGFSGNQ